MGALDTLVRRFSAVFNKGDNFSDFLLSRTPNAF